MLCLFEFTSYIVLFHTKISKITQEEAKLQWMKMVNRWYLLKTCTVPFFLIQIQDQKTMSLLPLSC